MNKIIKISTHGTQDFGYLSFFESKSDIPFEIKRIYYIHNVPTNNVRGKHAHKNLRQILWCPYGEIEIKLDSGTNIETYVLDSPEIGLLIEKGYWREMKWKHKNSVLCVAASDYYNEEDYIRDYNEFLNYIKEGYWNEKN